MARIPLIAGLLAVFCTGANAETGYWDSVCDAGACVASQLNVNGDGEAVMRTDISAFADGSVLFSVRVPNAVLLDEGPWLTIGGVFVGALSYLHCANGCIARMTLSAELATGLFSGADAVVTVVGLDLSRRGIPVALAGLEDALFPARADEAPEGDP